MRPMSSFLLLLTIALSGLSVPGTALHASGPSWTTATALAARIHADRGLVARATVGYRASQPFVMAVVDLAPEGKVQAEVQTASAFLRMRDAARRDGVDLAVVSGYRTNEQQEDLFRLYRRGRGPLAARPGTSNHQSGHALDLDMTLTGATRWLKRHARGFGFKRTVPSERWHWEHW